MPPRLRHETRILLLALLTGLPGAALGLGLLWRAPLPGGTRWLLAALLAVLWLAAALLLRARVVRPLQTLANLLAALREGDFSIRARGERSDDALGLVLAEINALSGRLREERIGALEATALLRQVMEAIEVAVFAFDEAERLRLVNRAGERLLDQPAPRLLDRDAASLGLAACLEGETPRTLEARFPGAEGRWEARRAEFRLGGRPHRLLVLADLSRALREEERAAWQRLVRVLGHEINNSLAPIRSIAGSLRDLARRHPRPGDWEEDLLAGLDVIHGRSAALARFMAAYARLTRLPPPRPEPLEVGAWARRVAALELRLSVHIAPGPDVTLRADGDQLEQLLINLVRNAADAALETGGAVELGWQQHDGRLELWVRDEGRGIANPGNLFVPFFTTKPSGTGIGLALSRQIAEAHGGTLTLQNRADRPGAEARLVLPVAGSG